ncbi:phage terminase small subunit [Nitratidesulfovibrio vulgaris]|uniref:phage terminase small subunit n=1 Tax=Nitratidesulfovibrio vulgaris TaxID=881 RepID=UPI0013DEA7EB|nr:phage terminase small subunit [Nitratidesulfovibrio vulgaris]
MSLMRRHQQAVREAASEGTPHAGYAAGHTGGHVLDVMPTGLMGGSQLAAMLDASLAEDLAMLHDVASIERKAEIKRERLIPKYRDYAARLMGEGARHELLGYYIVWCFDAGHIEEGLRVAAWAMEHGQPLPERFRAGLPLFVATQTLEWAEREYNAGRAFEPYLTQAQELACSGGDVPDDTVALFHRLRGLRAESDGDLATAERELARAFDLGAKVKTALEGVRKRLARTTETTVTPPASHPEG